MRRVAFFIVGDEGHGELRMPMDASARREP